MLYYEYSQSSVTSISVWDFSICLMLQRRQHIKGKQKLMFWSYGVNRVNKSNKFQQLSNFNVSGLPGKM